MEKDGPTQVGSADLPLQGSSFQRWLADRMTRSVRDCRGLVILRTRRMCGGWPTLLCSVLRRRDGHATGISSGITGRSVSVRSSEGSTRRAPTSSVFTSVEDARQPSLPPREAQESLSIGDQVRHRTERLLLTRRAAWCEGRQSGSAGWLRSYVHGLLSPDDGKWTVVQQGMNGGTQAGAAAIMVSGRMRRACDNPHAAIEGAGQGEEIINLGDRRRLSVSREQIDLLSPWDRTVNAHEFSVLDRAASRRPQ